MSVYGYARVSSSQQVEDGVSLGVQERQLRGWCMMQGHDLTKVFVEEGVSAAVPLDKRPEGGAMMAALRKGDTIVVSRLDRLFRSPLDALQTVEMARNKGVTIVVIDGLGDITGNGMGRAFMIISATFAEMERDALKARVKGVKDDQRSRGRYLGGKVPFGYRVEYSTASDGKRNAELLPVPAEQEIISGIRKASREGHSLRAIQAAIIRDYDGRQLSLAAISRIVSNR